MNLIKLNFCVQALETHLKVHDNNFLEQVNSSSLDVFFFPRLIDKAFFSLILR